VLADRRLVAVRHRHRLRVISRWIISVRFPRPGDIGIGQQRHYAQADDGRDGQRGERTLSHRAKLLKRKEN
jgi:hypothetical protein